MSGTDIVEFLLAFNQEYPVYKDKELVLSAQGHGSEYVAMASLELLNFNARQDQKEGGNQHRFLLQTLILTDPMHMEINMVTDFKDYNSLLFNSVEICQAEGLKRHCEEGISLGLG